MKEREKRAEGQARVPGAAQSYRDLCSSLGRRMRDTGVEIVCVN